MSLADVIAFGMFNGEFEDSLNSMHRFLLNLFISESFLCFWQY